MEKVARRISSGLTTRDLSYPRRCGIPGCQLQWLLELTFRRVPSLFLWGDEFLNVGQEFLLDRRREEDQVPYPW